MSNLTAADIIWDEPETPILAEQDIIWDSKEEIDPLAQAEHESYQGISPVVQFAKDIKLQNAQQNRESWIAGGAKAAAKQVGKEFIQGIDEYLVPIAKGEFFIPKTVVDTVAGVGTGVAKFITYPLSLGRTLFTQLAGGGIGGIDVKEAKKIAELETAIFNFEPKDPLAITALATLGSVPAGVKATYDQIASIFETNTAKQIYLEAGKYLDQKGILPDQISPEDVQAAFQHALDVGGWATEAAAYGIVLGPTVKAAKGKAKVKIPTMEELARAKTKEAYELVQETKGVPGLKETEAKLKKTGEAEGRIQEFRITPQGIKKLSETVRGRAVQETPKAKLAEEFNNKYPGHEIKYDQEQTFPAYGDQPAKSFSLYTPRKGPLEGATFSAKGEGVEGVKNGFQDLVNRFDKASEVTLDSLGFQKGYEKVRDVIKSVFTGKKTRGNIEAYRNEALQEVKGNPLDRMAVPYIKSRKFSDYIDNMSELGEIKPGELLRVDESTGKLIATIKDAKGKEKAAVRQSGFHAISEFQQSLKGFKDIGKLSYEWSDPTRLMQEMDQGKFGGPVQQHILWPIHSTTEAKYLWQDTWKSEAAKIKDDFKINSKKKAQAVGDVIEYLDNLKHPEVKRSLQKFKSAEKSAIIDAAKRTEEMLKNIRDEINAIRKKRNQKEIREIKGYRPHVREANIWTRWGFQDLKPAEIMDKPAMPDFIKPNQVWFKHALTRKGLLGKYNLERDMFKLLADYIDSSSRDIFDTNIIQHNKVHAAVMREAGLPHAAYALERLTAETFAGTGHWLTRGVRRMVPEKAVRIAGGIRRNLTRAVFPLNFTWNLFVQTSSAGLTFMRYGAINNIKGLQYFTSRSMNQAVRQNAYSHLTKSRWGGKIAYQDIADSVGRNRKLQAGKVERAEQFLNSFTSALESGLTGHAVASAYHHGKGLGLKGRALWEYASEGGGKTQSMYNLADRPGILKAREVGMVMPFQTFAFEIMNTVRELNIVGVRRVVGKTGAYETMSARSAAGKALISKRLGMLARWTAAIMVTNAVADSQIGRKPWRVSSFVPFIAYILNGSPMAPVVGEQQQRTLPVEYVSDFYKGAEAVIQYEDWRKLRKWALRYHAPAGIQLERTIEGLEANAANGWVTDVAGKKLFKIPEEERAKALLTGPWATSAGQERLGKKKEKKTLRTIK